MNHPASHPEPSSAQHPAAGQSNGPHPADPYSGDAAPVNSAAAHLTAGHLTEDELICRLHGVDSSAALHLDTCPQCRVRWTLLQQRHAAFTVVPRVPPGFFAAQRRRILERIQHRTSPWAPLLSVRVPATLAVILTAGLLYHRFWTAAPPRPTPRPAASAVEAEWFERAYSNIGSVEPRAASPIRGLFTEESAE